MKRVVILALAASSILLLNPLPGFARGPQPHGASATGSSHRGFVQQRALPSRTFSRGDYGRRGPVGTYSHRGYRPGRYPPGVYRPGHWRYPSWRYPYRSDVYFGGVWIEPGWNAWWGPAWPYSYPYYPSYYPYYSVPYPYYSAPPIVIEQGPTEYIQRDDEAVEPGYRYFCRDPEGYYPGVERCPSGWMKVSPSDVAPDQEEE